MRVDLGVLDPDYVNVLPTAMSFSRFCHGGNCPQARVAGEGKSSGRKGLRIIANIETARR